MATPTGKPPTGPRSTRVGWSAALRQERQAGVAVCDGDPLKLHYSWSLAARGKRSPARFHAEAAAVRSAIAAQAPGFRRPGDS